MPGRAQLGRRPVDPAECGDDCATATWGRARDRRPARAGLIGVGGLGHPRRPGQQRDQRLGGPDPPVEPLHRADAGGRLRDVRGDHGHHREGHHHQHQQRCAPWHATPPARPSAARGATPRPASSRLLQQRVGAGRCRTRRRSRRRAGTPPGRPRRRAAPRGSPGPRPHRRRSAHGSAAGRPRRSRCRGRRSARRPGSAAARRRSRGRSPRAAAARRTSRRGSAWPARRCRPRRGPRSPPCARPGR